VRPLWEDSENAEGGCWVVKVRKEDGRAVRTWEELCLMVCGGELQAVVARGTLRMRPVHTRTKNQCRRKEGSVTGLTQCRERPHLRYLVFTPVIRRSHLDMDERRKQPQEHRGVAEDDCLEVIAGAATEV